MMCNSKCARSSLPITIMHELGVIAVDLDDVLSQTNQAVADCEFKHKIPVLAESNFVDKGTTRSTGHI